MKRTNDGSSRWSRQMSHVRFPDKRVAHGWSFDHHYRRYGVRDKERSRQHISFEVGGSPKPLGSTLIPRHRISIDIRIKYEIGDWILIRWLKNIIEPLLILRVWDFHPLHQFFLYTWISFYAISYSVDSSSNRNHRFANSY
jgi:hypothetical protein